MAVPGTQSIYSVHNTRHPLKLKICSTPCLCHPCLLDNGEECLNALYTDPWTEVDLKPVKGKNLRKHMKRKDPREKFPIESNCEENGEVSSDDESLPNIVIPDVPAESIEHAEVPAESIERAEKENAVEENVLIDLTEDTRVCNEEDLTCEPIEIDDVIIEKDMLEEKNDYVNDLTDLIVYSNTEDIPYRIFWENILGSLEACSTFEELEKTAFEINETLSPLKPQRKNVQF